MELTLEQLEKHKKEILEQLIEDAGSVTHLARMLNINPMTPRGWVERNSISKAGAKLVADHPTLGEYYKAIDLRPDL